MTYHYRDNLRHIEMIANIRAHGVTDKRVLAAMRMVPRELFVPLQERQYAYEDIPLPIGMGQTISQPSLVAQMTEALDLAGTERVLEVGTGSGYQAAILSHLVHRVYSIERIAGLAATARERLHRLGYTNIRVFEGDGSLGLPEQAPFDAIIVTASSPDIPQPLIDQLKEGGRMVIPLGETETEAILSVCHKRGGGLHTRYVIPVRFVPLVGQYGWPAAT